MRVLGYARVSKEGNGNGVSLDWQREQIEAECERRGWHLIEVIEDAGASGKSLRRPGVRRALNALEAGDAEALVVAKLDRLSRSVIDFARTVERSQREGWALIVLDIGVDLTTPNGRLVAGVLANVAQWERELIGQRTKEALRVKRAQGVHTGRRSTLPPEIARRIKRRRSAGWTLRRIADKLNAEGVPTGQGGRRWYASTVRAVLDRRGRPR
jgi:DNA invertase Pin-like site-specific DNA recombinase